MEESNFKIEINHTTKVEDNYVLIIIISLCVFLYLIDHACFGFCCFFSSWPGLLYLWQLRMATRR